MTGSSDREPPTWSSSVAARPDSALNDDLLHTDLAHAGPGPGSRMTDRPVTPSVELLSHEGCPLVDPTRILLAECLLVAGLTVPVIERVGAYPSPTVLIDGADVMGEPDLPPGVTACRVHPPNRQRVLAALIGRRDERGHCPGGQARRS